MKTLQTVAINVIAITGIVLFLGGIVLATKCFAKDRGPCPLSAQVQKI